MNPNNLTLVDQNSKGLDNEYLKAVFLAFKEFLLEETAGNWHAEYRLKDKIEKAKTEHKQSRAELSKIIEPDIRYMNTFTYYVEGYYNKSDINNQ